MQDSPNELTAGTNELSRELSAAGRIHYGVWILIVGAFTIFGSIGLGRFAIGMIIPKMGSGLSLTNTHLGIIVSGTFLGYLVSTAVSGALATRFGPRKVIAAAMLLIAAGMVVAGSAGGFWMALAGQVLIGIGTGGSNVPANGLIARWFSTKLRGTASGLMAAGSGFGFALAGTLVPYLNGFYGDAGWRASWFYLGFVVFMIALLGAVVFRDDPHAVGAEPLGGAGGADPVPLPTKADEASGSVRWKDIYLSGALWRLGITYFMFGFSYVIFTTFFAKYLVEDVGITQVVAGRLWSLVGVASIASGFLWGMLSDKIGRKRALFVVYFIQGVCLTMLALSGDTGVITAVSVAYALTLWSIPAIMAATSADYVGGTLAPAAFGMITIFFGLGQVVSPWINGYIVDSTGSFAIPFMVSAGAGFAGAVLAAFLPKRA